MYRIIFTQSINPFQYYSTLISYKTQHVIIWFYNLYLSVNYLRFHTEVPERWIHTTPALLIALRSWNIIRGRIANVRFTQGTCFTRLNFLSFSAKSSFSVSFGQIFCFYHFITGCMGKSIFELQKIIQILTGCYDNRSDARKKQWNTEMCATAFLLIKADLCNSLRCLQVLLYNYSTFLSASSIGTRRMRRYSRRATTK